MTFNEKLIEKAKQIATEAHRGQKRFSGEDYITHPEAVAELAKRFYKPLEYQVISWLHDTIEDTKITEKDLLEEFPKYIVDAVVALSKEKDEPYYIYIKNLCNNRLAMMVKLCDLSHNMSTMPEGENKAWKEVNKKRLEKYQLTQMYIEEKLREKNL